MRPEDVSAYLGSIKLMGNVCPGVPSLMKNGMATNVSANPDSDYSIKSVKHAQMLQTPTKKEQPADAKPPTSSSTQPPSNVLPAHTSPETTKMAQPAFVMLDMNRKTAFVLQSVM